MRKTLILAILLIILFSCKLRTDNEEIINTTKEVLQNIYDNDFTAFKNKFGFSDLSIMGKDDESLKADFDVLHSIISRDSLDDYYNKIIIPNTINEIGQKTIKFKIPISLSEDSIFKEAHLMLEFGPPQIIPLKKLSGYRIKYIRR